MNVDKTLASVNENSISNVYWVANVAMLML